MLWGVMELEPLCQTSGLLRFKCFIKSGKTVCVQVIQDQAHSDGVRIALIEHALDPPGPFFSRSTIKGRHMSLACQRFHFEKDLGNPIADIFMVDQRGPSWCTSHGGLDLSDELFIGFIHTDQRIVGVIRQLINMDNIFHVSYERGAPFRRDFPVLPEMRLKFVFFSMRCTVICETLGAKSNSTAFSASNRTVHRRRPSGVSEQAKAIRRPRKPHRRWPRDQIFPVVSASAQQSVLLLQNASSDVQLCGVIPIASAHLLQSTQAPGTCITQSKARA